MLFRETHRLSTSYNDNAEQVLIRIRCCAGSLVLALAGVWGLIGPGANVFCLLFIIDRVKRRTMLLVGSLAMAVDIALVMALVAAFGGGPNTVANGFGIFFLLLFGILFSLSWNSGAPVYCTEIFPTSIRATGGAIGFVDQKKKLCIRLDKLADPSLGRFGASSSKYDHPQPATQGRAGEGASAELC
jgi:hypothetical protein